MVAIGFRLKISALLDKVTEFAGLSDKGTILVGPLENVWSRHRSSPCTLGPGITINSIWMATDPIFI